jgi:hypothetical protein
MNQENERSTFRRGLAPAPTSATERDRLATLAELVKYGGKPDHKKNPGDFGLHPPAGPRLNKSLCDVIGVFKKREALELLKEGVRRGMISNQVRNGWPKQIWSMTSDGTPLESQLENAVLGTYHGYPLPDGDPLADVIKKAWKERYVKN